MQEEKDRELMASQRRGQPRVRADLSVRISTADGMSTTALRIANISLGGVFIAMQDPFAFGTELALEFTLPAAPKTIRCKGFVTWSTKASPARRDAHGDGIGVRLVEIGITDMKVLAQFIEEELGP